MLCPVILLKCYLTLYLTEHSWIYYPVASCSGKFQMCNGRMSMVTPFLLEKEKIEPALHPTASNAATDVYHLKEMRWAGSEMFSNISKRSSFVAPAIHKKLYLPQALRFTDKWIIWPNTANSWQQINQKRTEPYRAPCLGNPLRTRLPVTWCNGIRSFCPVTVATSWAVDTSLLLATTTCSRTLTKEVHKPMRREVGMDENPEKDHKDSR